jgi:hypothetical protein
MLRKMTNGQRLMTIGFSMSKGPMPALYLHWIMEHSDFTGH